MAAWLTISSHCVLGALIAYETKASMPAMHCHEGQTAPTKGGEDQIPCCKVLKAISIAKVNIGASAADFIFREYPTAKLVVEISRAQTETLGSDTGPPGALSFSESVLQRSILAHAPPISLS